jgi:hypothetical protein
MGLTVFIYSQNNGEENNDVNNAYIPNLEPKAPKKQPQIVAGKLIKNKHHLTIIRDGQEKILKDTSSLMIGDKLITNDQQTVEMILFNDRVRLYLDKNSILSINKMYAMTFSKGSLHTEIQSNPSEPVYFDTNHKKYRVLGTSFYLKVNAGRSSIDMIEGKVEVKNKITNEVSIATPHQQPTSRVKITLTDFNLNPLPGYLDLSPDKLINVSLSEIPNGVMNIALNFQGLEPDHIKYIVKSPRGQTMSAMNSKAPWSVYGQYFKKKSLQEISLLGSMLEEGNYEIYCKFYYGQENHGTLSGEQVLKLNLQQ